MEGDEVNITVSRNYFEFYWLRVKEQTVLSKSDLHFGQYKAAANYPKMFIIHALMANIITSMDCASDRWEDRLSVMLKKVSRVAPVTN